MVSLWLFQNGHSSLDKVDMASLKLALLNSFSLRDVTKPLYVLIYMCVSMCLYIYIYRGLLDEIETDDQIAAVLAHEIGHIVVRHHEERARRNIMASIFRMVAVTGADTYQDKININNAVVELTLSYSREEEIEADTYSAKYVRAAGYNPEAVISMIEILIKTELEGPIRPKRRWRSHPYLSDRIKAAREEIYGQIDFMDYANTPTHGVER